MLWEYIWLWLVSHTRKVGQEEVESEVKEACEAGGPGILIILQRKRNLSPLSLVSLPLICWFPIFRIC